VLCCQMLVVVTLAALTVGCTVTTHGTVVAAPTHRYSLLKYWRGVGSSLELSV
jgi:hypothetical protein